MKIEIGNIVKFRHPTMRVSYGIVEEEIKIMASKKIEKEGCTFYIINNLLHEEIIPWTINEVDILEVYVQPYPNPPTPVTQ